ncbi:hypothetical protein K435DRAFT_355901, partial [Dendrothele bispora CBS 962.96]
SFSLSLSPLLYCLLGTCALENRASKVRDWRSKGENPHNHKTCREKLELMKSFYRGIRMDAAELSRWQRFAAKGE